MKSLIHVFSVALLALALTACGGLQDKLVGSWAIDVDALLENNKGLLPDGHTEAGREMLRKSFADTRVEFTQETFTFLGPKKGAKETGRYRIAKTEGQTVFIRVERGGDHAGKEAGWQLEFLDDDHLKGIIQSEPGKALYLQRTAD